jgi:N-acetylglucosaminyldiphosphoundecaprenol N-acetyl-beta-D-mannosaminyltransferase
MTSLRILGSRIDAISFSDALLRIRDFLSDGTPRHIITANTLMLMDAEHDPELHAILESAALVVPESSGILWASRRMGQPLKEFIPGIDLMGALCQLGSPIYLLGAKPGIAEAAARELERRTPGLIIAGTHHGYFPESEAAAVIETIRAAAPAFLFLGMSVPGQEKWIAKHLKELNVPVVMGVGGSFDVLCGRLNRAPHWMRRAGVEWLYRLIQEPWRWRRIGRLPVFAAKILCAQFKSA